MFVIYLHTKFHIFISSASLVKSGKGEIVPVLN